MFKGLSKALQDEFLLQALTIDCNMTIGQLRNYAKELVEDIETMTDSERKRIAEQFIRRADIKRDGVDLVLRGSGLIRYFKKGIGK